MHPTRRSLMLASLTAAISLAPRGRAGQARAATPLRIGTLRFGSLGWELDVIARHHLAEAAGLTIEPVEFASNQAIQVGLQGGRVDMVATDFLWVARSRAGGADWTFVPFSNALGALIAPQDGAVRAITDLPGKRLGIAGSPLDKSWLILRAFASKTAGIDLDATAQKSFGPPPLLAEQMAAGRLDAVLTFWPFAARAEAAGMRRVLAVEDALAGLGIGAGAPMVGFVFSEAWAAKNRATLDGFITAARGAGSILDSSDAEWTEIARLTGASGPAELARLRDWFRQGIPRDWGEDQRAAAAKLYGVLAAIGGPDLVGPAQSLPAGTFWQASWQSSTR